MGTAYQGCGSTAYGGRSGAAAYPSCDGTVGNDGTTYYGCYSDQWTCRSEGWSAQYQTTGQDWSDQSSVQYQTTGQDWSDQSSAQYQTTGQDWSGQSCFQDTGSNWQCNGLNSGGDYNASLHQAPWRLGSA